MLLGRAAVTSDRSKSTDANVEWTVPQEISRKVEADRVGHDDR